MFCIGNLPLKLILHIARRVSQLCHKVWTPQAANEPIQITVPVWWICLQNVIYIYIYVILIYKVTLYLLLCQHSDCKCLGLGPTFLPLFYCMWLPVAQKLLSPGSLSLLVSIRFHWNLFIFGKHRSSCWSWLNWYHWCLFIRGELQSRCTTSEEMPNRGIPEVAFGVPTEHS